MCSQELQNLQVHCMSVVFDHSINSKMQHLSKNKIMSFFVEGPCLKTFIIWGFFFFIIIDTQTTAQKKTQLQTEDKIIQNKICEID